jgi:MFS family permease
MYGVFTLPSLTSAVLIAVGLSLLPVFVRIEKTEKFPALRLTMFSNKGYKSASVSLFLNYAAANSVVMMVSLYLQSVGALTASEAGMVMLIQPLFQVLISPFAGRYSDRLDWRILPTAGMLAAFLGLLTLSTLDIGTPLFVVMIALIFTGICHGLFGAPNTNVMMGLCRREESSASASVIAIMRQSGMMVALGIAMFMISIFMGSTDNLVPSTYPEFVSASRYTFLVTAALALIGAVITWLYYPRRDRA